MLKEQTRGWCYYSLVSKVNYGIWNHSGPVQEELETPRYHLLPVIQSRKRQRKQSKFYLSPVATHCPNTTRSWWAQQLRPGACTFLPSALGRREEKNQGVNLRSKQAQQPEQSLKAIFT